MRAKGKKHIKPLEFNPPRTEWGDGPWKDEPDRVDFEHCRFPCLALRNYHGAWCGYVGVPAGHPAYGKAYGDVNVEVHGGLTYAGCSNPPIARVPKAGDTDDLYWLGFDCGHHLDLIPGLLMRSEPYPWEEYRDLEYVKREIRSLAEQLAA